MNKEEATNRIASILAQNTREYEQRFQKSDSPYLATDVAELNLEVARVFGFEEAYLERLSYYRKLLT